MAKERGRRFTGIELREDYCAMAVRRVQQEILNLQTFTPLETQSPRDAIARCIAEQNQAREIIHTPKGKLWAEDWVKEEVLIRLESGNEITNFEPVASGEQRETRG